MIDLKVKCTICGKEENNKDTIKEVSCLIEKYGLKAEHYLHLLNVMSDKCMDSDEHSFVFDETFLSAVNEAVTKHKSDITEIEKLKVVNEESSKETKELEIKIKELQAKTISNRDRMDNLYNSINIYKDELKESTGYSKIEIWY